MNTLPTIKVFSLLNGSWRVVETYGPNQSETYIIRADEAPTKEDAERIALSLL